MDLNSLMIFSEGRRSTAFNLFKKFNEVAEICKTAFKGNIHNFLVGTAQQAGRVVDAVMIQVIKRGFPGEPFEKPAEMVRA